MVRSGGVSLLLLAALTGCGQPAQVVVDGAPPRDVGAAQDAEVSVDVEEVLEGGELESDAELVPAEEASSGQLDESLRAMVRLGDDEAALEAVSRLSPFVRDSAPARYLRGRLLERLGRRSEAADAYGRPGEGLPPVVAAEARLRRVRLLARARRCEEARQALKQIGGSLGERGPQVRADVAACTLGEGDAEAALPSLQAIVAVKSPGVDLFAAKLSLAEALARTEKAAEAQKVLRDLLLSQPEHPDAGQAQARLKKLGGDLEWTTPERLRRARRLLAKRRFTRTIAELDPSTRPTRPGQLAQWLHLRGMALFRSRHNYAEAAKVLGEAARFSGPSSIDDEFHAARALSRADLDADAITAYRKLVRDHPRHESAAEAEYLAAWLELRLGKAHGVTAMADFLKGPRARSSAELQREATWHLAFVAFEKGQQGRAATYFGRYARLGEGALVRGRGLYWQGRALEAAGRKGRAAETYRVAIKVSPLHWYALLARQRLEGLGEEVPHPFPPLAVAATKALPTLPPARLPLEAAFYASLGLDEDALEALRRRESAIQSAAPAGRSLEAMVQAYHLLGGFRRAYRMTAHHRDELDQRPSERTQWLWDASYPRPYRTFVEREARGHGVDPSHVWATMRQESGYSPRVVSRADAIGLLQMLPGTARQIAKGLGVEFNRRQLFDPEWNVRYGVAEIGSLSKSFGKNLPLTIAAYNAGEARVRRWLEETGPIELDRFVERIPFDETRNYVRRVTSHYARYRFLEEPSVPWPLELPAKVGPRPASTDSP